MRTSVRKILNAHFLSSTFPFPDYKMMAEEFNVFNQHVFAVLENSFPQVSIHWITYWHLNNYATIVISTL